MAEIKNIFDRSKKENPDKDPHLYNWKKNVYSKDDVKEINKLLKSKTKKGYLKEASKKIKNGQAKYNGFSKERNQRVTFKFSYRNSLGMHIEYLNRYIPQLNKDDVIEKPEYFGLDYEEYRSHAVPLHFKLMISPESQNIDFQALTKTFIKRFEKLTGYELYWMGAVHNNTDNRHSHFVVNGVDKNGYRVRFPKEMIKHTIRDILSEAATKMIGERTADEIQTARDNMVYAKRWTIYDEELSKKTGRIYSEVLSQKLTNRLQFLSSIGLATKDGKFYTLDPNFEEVLKTTGRYNLYLEEYLKSDIPIELFKGGSITGKVDKVINFDKTESWNDAIIIRQNDRRYYIPVYQLHKTNLEGKTVSIENAHGGTVRNITDSDIRVIQENRYGRDFTR